MVQRKQSTVHKDAMARTLVRPDASDGRQPLRVHLDAYHRIWGSLLAINHRELHLATPSPYISHSRNSLPHTRSLSTRHSFHSLLRACEPSAPSRDNILKYEPLAACATPTFNPD